MKNKTVIIKEAENQVATVEILADAIVAMSEGIKRLRQGRLTDKALVLLIQHASPAFGGYSGGKVSAREINAVLEGIEAMGKKFLKTPTSIKSGPTEEE